MADGFTPERYTDAELNAIAEEMAVNYERLMEAKESDVIAAMVGCGCTEHAAREQLKHPQLGLYARQFYLDYVDMNFGNVEAKRRVEKCRESWGRLSRQRVV